MKETRLSRRAFLGLGATAAVAAGAAGLAGCAPQQSAGTASAEGDGSPNGGSASSVSPTKYTPDFLTPPPVPTDVKEEKDCDVLVIGMGIAGTAAAKEAAEAGKKVIVLEKQPEDSYSVISMAGDFGVVGSQIQKDLGIEWAPKEDIFNEFVKETGGRCDTWMMNYWYDTRARISTGSSRAPTTKCWNPPRPTARRTSRTSSARSASRRWKPTTTRKKSTPTSTAPLPRTRTCSGRAKQRSTQPWPAAPS